MSRPIIDLVCNSYVACHVGGTNFHPAIVLEINSKTKSAIVCDIETQREETVMLKSLYPILIQKGFLRKNNFIAPQETDHLQRWYHQELPITFSPHTKELVIYGKPYPTQIRFVHNLQSALISCGIIYNFSLTGSELSAKEIIEHSSRTIENLVGGVVKNKLVRDKFIDTTSLFGNEVPPLSSINTNREIDGPQLIPSEDGGQIKASFVPVSGLKSRYEFKEMPIMGEDRPHMPEARNEEIAQRILHNIDEEEQEQGGEGFTNDNPF